MDNYEVTAELREGSGKGDSRRLRRDGMVPAVLYGGDKAPRNLQVLGHKLEHQLENEAFYSHILKVTAGGESANAVLKALQRDPASGRVIHVDFQRVKMSEKLVMRVPVHLVNDETSVGRKAGGIINQLENEIEISCLPKDLPEFIEVDIAELDIGEAVHLSQVKMPEGVELATAIEDAEHDHSVVSIDKAYEMAVEPEEEGEAAEDETDEEPKAED